MIDEEYDVLTTHLPHKLTMLHYCLEQVNDSTRDVSSNEKDPRRITAFECFWLHARNLIEFFRNDDPNASTVCPHIFTKTKNDYGFGRDLMDRINAQITHLQRGRGLSANGPLRGEDMIRVKERIDGAVAQFQAGMKDELKELWTHRTPMAIDYVPDLWATACTEIQIGQLEASRPNSLIFHYHIGSDVTVTVDGA